MYPRLPVVDSPGAVAGRSKALGGRGGAGVEDLPGWAISPGACAGRAMLQGPAFAMLGLVAPAEVSGVEVLAGVTPPVLFVANHTSHLDSPTLLRAMPSVWRRRVAVVAAADYFFSKPWLGASVTLLMNTFPFSRSASPTSVRRSLAHCAWLLDRGWSLLLYPEGTRSCTGEMAEFKSGVGLLAVRLGVPVVPVYMEGLHKVLPKGQKVPRPGRVQVSFGNALSFEPETPYDLATQAIEGAVRALGEGSGVGD
ncbi:MAG TPA: lysophospholipid acyltransferase family protein [Chloroflexia bacterium]